LLRGFATVAASPAPSAYGKRLVLPRAHVQRTERSGGSWQTSHDE
jgi:hypothetical protein